MPYDIEDTQSELALKSQSQIYKSKQISNAVMRPLI